MCRFVFCVSFFCQCDELFFLGDVNRDCFFDFGDVIFVFRFYLFLVFNFVSDVGIFFVQLLMFNQLCDFDVDRSMFVNLVDVFYLMRVLLGLVCFVFVVCVILVQFISFDCQLLFSVILMLKNGFVLDIDIFVFFDIIYGGSFIDFVGFIVFYRVVGIYGNVI